jgi:hypothetical protein
MKYTVQHGETLNSIAVKIFGDEEMVHYLASINQIPGKLGGGLPYPVKTGQVIETGTPEVEGKINYTWLWITLILVVIAIFLGWRFSR